MNELREVLLAHDRTGSTSEVSESCSATVNVGRDEFDKDLDRSGIAKVMWSSCGARRCVAA